MHFLSTLSTLMTVSVAFTGLSAALPAASPADAPAIAPAVPPVAPPKPPHSGGTTAPANPSVEDAPNALTNQSKDGPYRLPEFDFLWWNLPPIAIKTWGKYNTCYNLPWPFAWQVGSITMTDTKSPGCWVYATKNCAGSYKIVDKKGIAVYDGGISSFICDPK